MLFSAVYSLSVDCPDLINLAKGLNMHLTAPNTYDSVVLDCCDTPNTKVTCTNDRATVLWWNDLNLNGKINGTAIPSTLTNLNLFSNFITGFDPVLLPDSIKLVNLWDNYLVNLPLNIPANCEEFVVPGNLIVGELPPIPLTLLRLWLTSSMYPRYNKISGTIKLTKPFEIRVQNNSFTSIEIIDTTLLVGNCDISNNPLLGHPSISNLGFCTQNSLFANTVTTSYKTQPITSYSTTAVKGITETSLTPVLSTRDAPYSSELSLISKLQSSSLKSSITVATSPFPTRTVTSKSTSTVDKLTRAKQLLSTFTSLATTIETIQTTTIQSIDTYTTDSIEYLIINNSPIPITLTLTNYFYMIKIIIDSTCLLVMIQTYYFTIKNRHLKRFSYTSSQLTE